MKVTKVIFTIRKKDLALNNKYVFALLYGRTYKQEQSYHRRKKCCLACIMTILYCPEYQHFKSRSFNQSTESTKVELQYTYRNIYFKKFHHDRQLMIHQARMKHFQDHTFLLLL